MVTTPRHNGQTTRFTLERVPIAAESAGAPGVERARGDDRPVGRPVAGGRRATGQLLKDRYVLGDVLGHGSLGTTYRAYDRHTQRSVAIKLLSERYVGDARFGERFMAAAAQGERLVHPHIVAVLDAGFDEERPFVVSELVEGESLRAVLSKHGALPVRQATTLATEVADALAAAHRQHVPHGDLRPENVLLDGRGRARVADFGFVRAAVVTDQTLLGGAGKRIPYVPPEQLGRDPMDEPADQYALGVMLYELLTGAPPASGRDVLRAAARGDAPSSEPISPGRLRPDVPLHVDRAVARALCPSPADRFANVEQLREALAGRDAGVVQAASAVTPAIWRAESRRRPRRGETGMGERAALLVPLLASLAILLAGAGLLISVLPRLFGGMQMVDVPNLVDYDLAEASSIASAHGLNVKIVDMQLTDAHARNTLLHQDPPENGRLRRGNEVKLTLSAGIRPPNVVGKSLEDARATLVRAGWAVAGVETRADSSEAAGTVTGSRPGPDEAVVDKKQGLTLLVSAGNLVYRRPVRLSTGDASPAELVDGDPNTVGTLPGDAPTWLEIDLARPATVAAVELITSQEGPGETIHEVWVWTAGQFRGMHTFVGPTDDNQTLTVRFDQPMRDVTAVRIATTRAQGPIGWRDVRVFER